MPHKELEVLETHSSVTEVDFRFWSVAGKSFVRIYWQADSGIRERPYDYPPDLQAEIDLWDRASDEDFSAFERSLE